VVLAKAIKKYRLGKGITQAELANRSGFDPKTISRFETGEYVPTVEAVYKFAEILGVPVKEFFADLDGEIEQRAFLFEVIHNADADENDKWLSYDGQKHETHFQANERDKAHGKEMRETFQKEVSLKGNLVQIIYLVVCVLVFAGAQGFESGLGYVLLLPMIWGLYALTKFVNKFTQEQRDRVFGWTIFIIAVISITMLVRGIVK
jgi:transcriptional regulator with XRE-family HTH domain